MLFKNQEKIGNTNYTYLYKNGLLVQETRGDEIFDYSYDANGSIRMLKHRATEGATPTYYYYALNSRNDVVGLYNSSGAVCAKYTYDPWGNITSVTNASGTAITDTNNIAHTQPFRYRSYYYDTDSKFYYLQSRYYDPLTHRFINADACYDTGTGVLGYNMFAYCGNNPVNFNDPTGMSSHYCGNPSCFICRPERRDYINEHVDWYNDVTGSNILGVDYCGNFIYPSKIELDYNSTEYKVIRTIGIGMESLELSIDLGFGYGYYDEYINLIGYGIESTVTYHWDMSGHSGVDSGTAVTPISASGNLLGFGDTLEWSSFVNNEGVISFTNLVDESTTLFAIGRYILVGGGIEVGFNNKHFRDEVNKIW